MNVLNVAINNLFRILTASSSSFLVRTLLGALAISRAILPVGWPDDYMLSDCERFDFIVIGSGSAGAIVAKRLAEILSLRTLLIEAGGDPPPTSVIPSTFTTLAGTEYDYNYKEWLDSGLGNARIENSFQQQRGKVLGGSSSVNYLVYSRGVPQDYDDWSAIAPGWSWSEVLPYFKKFEGNTDPSVFTPDNAYLHSANGPVLISRPKDNPVAAEINANILRSYREMGIPTVSENNGCKIYGASRPHYTFANGRRSSTAEAYLRYNQNDRPNLSIAKYTKALKLIFEPGTLRVIGAKLLLRNGRKINVYVNKEVVVSAGSIDTPKLLMLSGIGPREDLERVGIPTLVDLPVGKNLQDHVFIPMPFYGKRGLSSVASNLLVPTQLDAFPVPFQCSFFTLDIPTPYVNRPLFQTFNIYVGATASLLVYFGCKGYGYNDDVCASVARDNTFRELNMHTLILLHPESKGSVTLKSDNHMDDPYIQAGFFRERVDLETLREGAKFMRTLENATYFRKNDGYFGKVDLPECAGMTFGSNAYWECYIRNMAGSMAHPVGTCRMGPGGVVDERLTVHGVRGLRIADASVMPMIPSGNTNAPTMMIGEKAADMIKEDYGLF